MEPNISFSIDESIREETNQELDEFGRFIREEIDLRMEIHMLKMGKDNQDPNSILRED